MAYPGEDVFINLPPGTDAAGGISGVDTTGFAGGRWITIAGLRIEAGGNAGPGPREPLDPLRPTGPPGRWS